MKKPAEMTISHSAHARLHAAGIKLTGASVHHTLGPHYREIIWIERLGSRVPHVCDTHSVRDLQKILSA